MFKKNDGWLPWYMYLLPFVAALLLLDSGLFQQHLTGITIEDRNYKVNEFNFYYFTQYEKYVNGPDYDEDVYDVSVNARRQYVEDDYTFADYFADLALDDILECYAVAELTETVSELEEEIDARVEAHREASDEFMTENDLETDEYFENYYGNGMTETLYYSCYRELASMEVYREYLLEQLAEELSDSDIEAWIAENWTGSDYNTANYVAVYLEPVVDRHTDETGEEQMEWLLAQTERLQERFEEDPTAEHMSELAVAYSVETIYNDDTSYSTAYIGAEETLGISEAATKDDVEDEALSAWLFDEDRTAGDVGIIQSEEGVWLVYYEGAADTASHQAASEALAQEAYESMIQELIDTLTVKSHGVAMHFAG